jgi:hypothetical protein
MIITDKIIRELQRRVDVSYEDAERYVRRAGGNIDMAEAYARRKQNSLFHRAFRGIENLLNITFVYRLKVYRKDDVLMDMPIFLFFVLLLIVGIDRTITVGVIFVIIALVAECQLKLHKLENQEEFRFYRTVKKENNPTSEADIDVLEEEIIITDDSSSHETVDSVEQQVKSTRNSIEDDSEDYYEVTIDK